jgi:hypothetical protein
MEMCFGLLDCENRLHANVLIFSELLADGRLEEEDD